MIVPFTSLFSSRLLQDKSRKKQTIKYPELLLAELNNEGWCKHQPYKNTSEITILYLRIAGALLLGNYRQLEICGNVGMQFY